MTNESRIRYQYPLDQMNTSSTRRRGNSTYRTSIVEDPTIDRVPSGKSEEAYWLLPIEPTKL